MKRLLLSICLVRILGEFSVAQNFPDVPENNFLSISFRKYTNQVAGWSDPHSDLMQILARLRTYPNPWSSSGPFDHSAPPRTLSELKTAERDIPEIIKILVEYRTGLPLNDVLSARRELISIHGSIRARIAGIEKGFGDVPGDHWAKAATDALSSAGLLVGEPLPAPSYPKFPQAYVSILDFAPRSRDRLETRREIAAMLTEAYANLTTEFAKWTEMVPKGGIYVGSRSLTRAAAIAEMLPGFKRLISTYEKEMAFYDRVDLDSIKKNLAHMAAEFERLSKQRAR